ncbi:hypothetical protein BGZ63DRAFT_421506 [Mariannaea sp. PMI_226]|nr:hypothetical protein BGZ63DRAFT_421506 [Mariannaea sp. PMI_226]
MSQKNKNANILSFFKPVAKSTQDSEAPQTPRKLENRSSLEPPSPSPIRLPPSPSPLPPSPCTPAAKALTPPTRDREIRASDDEDEFASSSDDSLENLSSILNRTRPVKGNDSPVKKLFTSSRSKRTTGLIHSSPLAIVPKHKFDFKALARDAKKDIATNESSSRHRAFSDTEDDVGTPVERSGDQVENIVKHKDVGHTAQRVLRTVQRSGAGHLRPRYCFFDVNFNPPPSTPPPRNLKGPWRIWVQADDKTREEYFRSGVPTALFKRHGSLPDELFIWLIDELCVHQSFTYREECADLITNCPEQVERLVTPGLLKKLFSRLGVSANLDDRESELPMSALNSGSYEGRDWGCLESFLSVLKTSSVYMVLPSVVYTCHALLRMALDGFLHHTIDVLKAFEDAIRALLHAVPLPNWDYFCFATCSMVYNHVKSQSIRSNVLACLPRDHIESNELRRRLAVAFLFEDPELSRQDPDKVVTIRALANRLDRDDFRFKSNTDFTELQAGITFFDAALDDGCFSPTGDLEDEKRFNQDVDELTKRLRELWKEINDSGMKLSRTELKSTIEWVRQRLMYSVRTRKKAKNSIFDREDVSLPKQQAYMKSFLSRVKEKDEIFQDAVEVREELKEIKEDLALRGAEKTTGEH